jgi:hypothetical protein
MLSLPGSLSKKNEDLGFGQGVHGPESRLECSRCRLSVSSQEGVMESV